MFLDEISFVDLVNFDFINQRLNEIFGKSNTSSRFGERTFIVAGDFLQLPPVDKDGSRKSLAVPLDHVGRVAEEVADAEEGDVNEGSTAKKEAKVEGRQGFELWRSITRVVCLTVNVRAPGVLSQLQA